MYNRVRARVLLLAFSLVVMVALLYPALYRGYETLLLLTDMSATGAVPSHYLAQQLSRKTVHFSGEGRDYVADLYLSAQEPHGAIVLQHGAAQAGKDDERLVLLAEQLARAHFAVLVPEMPGAKNLKVSSEDIPVLLYAVDYLQNARILKPRRAIGIGGFSIAAGLAIHAAMLPELQDRVSFILAVGGYHDLPQTLGYMTTGHFSLDGQQYQLVPNEYGKWVFVQSNVERIDEPQQRELLQQIATHKLSDATPVSDELISQLKGEALNVYRYIENRNPEQSLHLLQQLPASLRAEINRLDLAAMDLSPLRAQLLLVHGMHDSVIPYSQSIALQRALPPSQTQLYLLKNWTHVDPHDGMFDAWQMFRALYRLLELRDTLRD
ncbi:MAG: alpha/beta fold hydrolase [Pseudomonadota bacterium]